MYEDDMYEDEIVVGGAFPGTVRWLDDSTGLAVVRCHGHCNPIAVYEAACDHDGAELDAEIARDGGPGCWYVWPKDCDDDEGDEDEEEEEEMTETTIRVMDLGEEWQRDEWQRYGVVRVELDGAVREVGCVIGVPDSLIGTARAAGTVRGLIDAWYADSSDWAQAPGGGLTGEQADEAIAAIAAVATRLWFDLDDYTDDERPTCPRCG